MTIDKPRTLRQVLEHHRCVDSVCDLLEAIDTGRPVAASLVRPRDPKNDEWVLTVVDGDGVSTMLPGEGSYREPLDALIKGASDLQIAINAIPNWPPCKDPRWCEPDVYAREQRLLRELMLLMRTMVPRPPVDRD